MDAEQRKREQIQAMIAADEQELQSLDQKILNDLQIAELSGEIRGAVEKFYQKICYCRIRIGRYQYALDVTTKTNLPKLERKYKEEIGAYMRHLRDLDFSWEAVKQDL